MSLTAELDRIGMTKQELAEVLGVNRKTIQRMGEEISPEVQTVLNASKEPEYKWVKPAREITEALDGKGRGVPSEGYVLISKGTDDEGIVSETHWKARFDYTCKHGLEGWSCKRCLK